MPWWPNVSNLMITFAENLLTGAERSMYRTGYRAYSRALVKRLPFESNSNDFVFKIQLLMQIFWVGETITEITCPLAIRRTPLPSTLPAAPPSPSNVFSHGLRCAHHSCHQTSRFTLV